MNKKLQWKVHLPNLLKEIANNSGSAVLRQPLNITGHILADVGKRASELNDPELNALMCRLTIYSIADPESPDYDEKRTKQIIKKYDLDN